jgi:hypothetical protein
VKRTLVGRAIEDLDLEVFLGTRNRLPQSRVRGRESEELVDERAVAVQEVLQPPYGQVHLAREPVELVDQRG